MSIVSAWLLPNGINVEPQFILVDVTDYDSFMADLPNHIDWLNDDQSNIDIGLAVVGVGDDYAALTTVIICPWYYNPMVDTVTITCPVESAF